jgi:Uma2 family endonuclease
MGFMTMTDILGPRPDGWWSIDDLEQLPDDGMRYELADGCLLVSPPSTSRHGRVGYLLRRLLDRQAPDGLAVSNDAGIQMGSKYSYFVPDLFVIPMAGFESHPKYLVPAAARGGGAVRAQPRA